MTDPLARLVRDMLDGRENDEEITVSVSLLWSLVYKADALLNAAARAELDALLPTFTVGRVVPPNTSHDRCSIHGDIGPNESIDAHARDAHGSSAEQIRKARNVIKRARWFAALEAPDD